MFAGCSWRVESSWRSVPFHANDTLGPCSPRRRNGGPRSRSQPGRSLAGRRLGSWAGQGKAGEAGQEERRQGRSLRHLQRLAQPQQRGQLVSDLSTPNNAQAALIAETIQRVNPDILLINEFDFYPDGEAADCSGTTTSRCRTTALRAWSTPTTFVAPSNTGMPSGFDLNNNGARPGWVRRRRLRLRRSSRASSAWSSQQVPHRVRRRAHLPALPLEGHAGRVAARRPGHGGADDWYSPAELDVFRLSSKSPLGRPDRDRQQDRALPGLATRRPRSSTGPRTATGRATTTRSGSGPTTSPVGTASYIYDDAGRTGGLAHGARS